MRFCIEDALAEGLKPFSVASLANTTTWINNNCPGDILRNNTLPLAAAISLTTGNPSFVPRLGPWTTYAIELVLERLTDFKLPLLVLILQVAFAPLGLCELACALLHLMINPGDSISSYMFTLADCHALLERVREVANGRLEHASAEHKEELCRVLTLILIAYSTSGRPISDDQIEVYVCSMPLFVRTVALILCSQLRPPLRQQFCRVPQGSPVTSNGPHRQLHPNGGRAVWVRHGYPVQVLVH